MYSTLVAEGAEVIEGLNGLARRNFITVIKFLEPNCHAGVSI